MLVKRLVSEIVGGGLEKQIIFGQILLNVDLFGEELVSEREGGLEGELQEDQETEQLERTEEDD